MSEYGSLFALAKTLTGYTITSLSEIGQLKFLKQLLNAIDGEDFKCNAKNTKKGSPSRGGQEICNWNKCSSLAEIMVFITDYYSTKMQTDIVSWIDKINVYREPIQLWKIILGMGIRGPNNSKFINIVLNMNPDRNLQELTNSVIERLQNLKQQTVANQISYEQNSNQRNRKESSDFKEIAQLGQEIEYLRTKYMTLKKQYDTYKKESISFRTELQNQLKIYRSEKAYFETTVAETGFYRGRINASPGQVVRDLCEQIYRLSREIQKQKQIVKVIREDNQELMSTLEEFEHVNNQYGIAKQNQIQLQNALQQMGRELDDYRVREREYYNRFMQLESQNQKLSRNLKNQFQQRRGINNYQGLDSINLQTKNQNQNKKKGLAAMGKQKSTTVLKFDYKDDKQKSKIQIPDYDQSPQKSTIFQPQNMRNLLNEMKSPHLKSQIERLRQENIILSNQNRVLKMQNDHLCQMNIKYEEIISSYKSQNSTIVQKYENLYDQLSEKTEIEIETSFKQLLNQRESQIVQEFYNFFHKKEADYEQRLHQVKIKLERAVNKYKKSKKRNKEKKKQKKANKDSLSNFRRSFMKFQPSSYNQNGSNIYQQVQAEHQNVIQENDPQLALDFNFKKGNSQLQVVPEQMTQRTNVQNIESIAENNFEGNFTRLYKESVDSDSGAHFQAQNFDNHKDYQEYRRFNYDGSFQMQNMQVDLPNERNHYEDVNVEEFDPIDQTDIYRNSVNEGQNQREDQKQDQELKKIKENSTMPHLNQFKTNQVSQQPYCSIVITPPSSGIIDGKPVSTIFTDNDFYGQAQGQHDQGDHGENNYQNNRDMQENQNRGVGTGFGQHLNFEKRNSLEKQRQYANKPSLLSIPLNLKKISSQGKKGQIQQILVEQWDMPSARSIKSRMFQFASHLNDFQEQDNESSEEQSIESQDYENAREKVMKKLDYETNILNKEVLNNQQEFQKKLRQHMIRLKESSKGKIISLEKQLESVTQVHMTMNEMFNRLFLKHIQGQTKKQQQQKREIQSKNEKQRQQAQNRKNKKQIEIEVQKLPQLIGDSSEVMELLRGITKEKEQMLCELENLRRIKDDRDVQSGKVKQLLEVIQKLRNQFQEFKRQQEIIKMKLRSALTNQEHGQQTQKNEQAQSHRQKSFLISRNVSLQIQTTEKHQKIAAQEYGLQTNSDEFHSNDLEIKHEHLELKQVNQEQQKKTKNKIQILSMASNSVNSVVNAKQKIEATAPFRLKKIQQQNLQSVAIGQLKKIQQSQAQLPCKIDDTSQKLSYLAKLQNQVLKKSLQQLQKKNTVLRVEIQVMTGAIAQLRQMAKCRSFFK